MNTLFTISEEELRSDKWAKARFMCERYGYDIHEIAAGIAKFRMSRYEARAEALRAVGLQMAAAVEPQPAQLVHFNSVKQFWNARHQQWAQRDIVYIGRAMSHPSLNLPASPFGNPFRIEKDTNEARDDAIEMYLNWIQLPAQADLLRQLDHLRGKTLVCFCRPRRCHGDVLLQLLREKASTADEAHQLKFES